VRDAVRQRLIRLRRWLVDWIIDYLTQPLPRYEQRVHNDLDSLKRAVRKADVILIEGDQRVSAIIRYLTQSPWSHSALYIGDELLRRGGEDAAWAQRHFGDEAEHLIVEALPRGVQAAPLGRYIDFNLRVCRPHRLRPEHARVIMDEAVAAIGWSYDLQNVLDLTRYLLPVRIVPERWRASALHFGSGQPTEVICSSLLARVFGRVRFPILPESVDGNGNGNGSGGTPMPSGMASSWGRALAQRVLGRPSRREYTGLLRMRHPTLITPRDFDLSPYFDIIKFNPLGPGDFDYSRIHWDAAVEGREKD
jgi:hypothetical protein